MIIKAAIRAYIAFFPTCNGCDICLAAEVKEDMPAGAKVANSDLERSQDEPELDEDICSSEQESDEDEDGDLPTFEFRFETAKLLIELDDKTEAATKACTAHLHFPLVSKSGPSIQEELLLN